MESQDDLLCKSEEHQGWEQGMCVVRQLRMTATNV